MKYGIINPFTIGEFTFLGAHFFYEGDRVCLLQRIHGTTIFVDKTLFHELSTKQPTESFQFKLVVHGFAHVSNSPFVKNGREEILPRFFIIDLTDRCNLACKYCFRDLSQDQKLISDEVLDLICNRIADFCIQHHISNFSIQPWGGEPLLAINKIFHIRDFFTTKNLNPQISIETNGTLITDDIALKLARRNISVGVSIDGPPSIHDSQRVTRGGSPSFKRVLQGIDRLKKCGHENTLSTISVITKTSIGCARELLDFFSKEMKLKHVKFNIIRGNSEDLLSPSPIEIKKFIEDLFDGLIQLYEDGYDLTEGNIVERLYNLLLRRNRNICKSRGCMGGRSMISFNKYGYVFPCEMTDYTEEKIGDIHENIDFCEMITEAEKTNAYYKEKRIDACDSCPWWYFCRGGCSTAIRYKNKQYKGIDENECLINKLLYPSLINFILTKPHLAEKMVGNAITIGNESL